MQIAINNKNEIIGYAFAGQLANGIDCNVDIPADFVPGKYLLMAEETDEDIIYSIVPNPDYTEPMTEPEPPTNAELAAALTEVVSLMMGGV